MHTQQSQVGPGAAEARAQSILSHAQDHQRATADRSAPHWEWISDNSELRLERVYPRQGLRVAQSDVVLFVRGED